MLENFNFEINVLSDKRISYELLDSTLEEINKKLPKNKDPMKKLFEFSVNFLMDCIKLKKYEIVIGMSRFVFLSNFPNRFENIRKKGVLRPSKYEYETKVLKEIIKYLNDKKYFNEDELRYFRNVNALLKIAPDIKDEKLKVIEAIKSRKNFLKNSLAIGEMIFNDLHYDIDSFFSKDTLHEVYYSKNKESILESVSMIVGFHKEIYQKIDSNEINFLDEAIDKSFYQRIFFYAYKIKEFNEAEIKIDFYDYDLVFDDKKSYVLVNVDFEKSKVFGYAKAEMRNRNRCIQLLNKVGGHFKSFHDYLNNLWEERKNDGEPLYFIKTDPVERIVVNSIFNEGVNLFNNDNLFLEEFSSLVNAFDENYNKNLYYKKIYEDFTILDVIKIQRFFYYISFIYKKVYELIKNEKGEDYAFLLRKRSVIPVIKDGNLYDILVRISGKEQEKCKNFIDKFTNFYEDKNDVIDLQYKPLLKSDDNYLVMPTVLAFSNLIRSFSVTENVHLSSYDDIDYMILDVESAFKEQGFFVEKDFDYGVDEVDVVALKDNNLFLFECKNPYHPVNDFELRNTFHHISKGFSQLDKFKRIMTDQSRFKNFLSKLEIDYSKDLSIHYGVINANRAMCGFSKDGFKVFHANELINFIKSGIIISNDKNYHCWDSDTFTVKDFIAYINGDKITNDFHDCMADQLYFMPYRNHLLGLKTFSFDPSKMGEIAKEKYREVN